MKQYFILAFIFCFSISIYSQKESDFNVNAYPILTADSINYGAYLNMEEFLNNSPSLTKVDFVYVDKKSPLRKMNGVVKNTINFFDHDGTLIETQNPIWGYSDGKNVFINGRNISGYYLIYYKLEKRGRFCLLNYSRVVNNYGNNNFHANNGGVTYKTYTSSVDRVFDITSGESFELTVKSLKKKVLIHDAELLKKFESESMRKTMTIKYLNDLNKKFYNKQIPQEKIESPI